MLRNITRIEDTSGIMTTVTGAERLPSWALWLIISLGIVGILIAGWGIFSWAVLGKNKKAKNDQMEISPVQKIFSTKSYKWSETNNITKKAGIFAMYIGSRFDETEFFIPMYLEESNDLCNAIDKLKQELINAENRPLINDIREYMIQKSLDQKEIRFYIIEDKDITLEQLKKITKINKRGFN